MFICCCRRDVKVCALLFIFFFLEMLLLVLFLMLESRLVLNVMVIFLRTFVCFSFCYFCSFSVNILLGEFFILERFFVFRLIGLLKFNKFKI